jgi:hypothetical protein
VHIYIERLGPTSVWRFKVLKMLTLICGLCCVGFTVVVVGGGGGGGGGVRRQTVALSIGLN